MKTLIFVFFTYLIFPINSFAQENQQLTHEVNDYIQVNWHKLTRSLKQVEQIIVDPKFKLKPGEKFILYISPKENIKSVKENLLRNISADELEKIDIRVLPKHISSIKQHGLLYLPYPYVVPGGRFNEFYGWDNYFIVLGLIKSNQLQLAKNVVDNLVYEINYYGTILNANRSYQLQRSQPPLLTEAVLAVFNVTQDKNWLRACLPAILKLHTYWTTAPHLIPEVGLSRYYALGKGPAPEVVSDENYYPLVEAYYKTNSTHAYNIEKYYDFKNEKLKAAFYTSDRTVRESGFDLTGKYGPFGAMITEFIPVDLNVLLYKMESDIANIYKILNDPQQEYRWLALSKKRKDLINKYLWDESLGYYFDYNFVDKKQYPYVFATTFYPLWAGVASPQQARRILQNLPNLETSRGIITSTYVTGNQWDAPFGWAPLQYFAVEGLAHYGYCADAKRIATDFLNTVNNEFAKKHVILEKYNMLDGDHNTEDNILYGYNVNQAGFGWTNGVYLTFQDFLRLPSQWCHSSGKD